MKIFRRLIGYAALGCLYFIGYCNGYDDGKQKNDYLKKVWNEQKKEVLNKLDELTDDAYSSIKELIKENGGK